VLRLARSLVRHRGYAAVAIDAPDHGDRGTPEGMARLREQIVSGQFGAEQRRRMEMNGALAAREWRATLDAMEALPDVGKGPVGYWGLSMGTAFGVPLIHAEPRIRCAVLGLFGLRFDDSVLEQAARRIAVPLLFLFQANDELVPLKLGLALFAAFGSQIKTLHLNPGGHVAVPAFEREYYETFFARYLAST
jgi:pimeloyl-ACP methyl ester carboxylesterase